MRSFPGSGSRTQPDSPIITSHRTRSALNSVRLLADHTVLYADAQLSAPTCLSFSRSGSLRICDSASGRIRKLIPPAPGRWVGSILNPEDHLPQSPGSWQTVLGDFENLPTHDWSSSISAAGGALPTSLAGVTASLGGNACVISYISPDRIDLRVPMTMMSAASTQSLRLTLPGNRVITRNVSITPLAAPEFSDHHARRQTLPGGGRGHAWVCLGDPRGPRRSGPNASSVHHQSQQQHQCTLRAPYNEAQLVLGRIGYPILQARPLSPGVTELTVQLSAGLPPGVRSVRVVFGGYMSRLPTMLPPAGDPSK